MLPGGRTNRNAIHDDGDDSEVRTGMLDEGEASMTNSMMSGNMVADDFDVSDSASVVTGTPTRHPAQQPKQVEKKKKRTVMTEPSQPVSNFGFGNDRDTSDSTVADPEFGSSGFRQVDYALNDVNGKGGLIVQKSMFTRRKLRAVCVSLFLFIFLIVLWHLSFTSKDKVVEGKCDLGISSPYSSNRNVSWAMCVDHKESSWNNAQLTDFLLPAEKALKNPPIRFLVIGDFGRDGFCCQRDVAVEMERAAAAIQADFVVNTGDSFYDGGIMTSSAEQVKTSFLNVYNQTYLRNLRFVSALGNNEYRGSVEAVLQLTDKHSRRFEIGKNGQRYFTKIVQGSSDMHLQLVFMDTSPMIESYKIPAYDSPQDYMLKRDDGVKSQWDKVESQVAWVEDRLQNEKYPFIMRVVVGHHPIFGQTSHVGEDRSFLQKRIAPLLEKYNVTAAFAGHDHNLQMVQPGKTAYFISGAGSKVAPAAQNTPDSPDSAVRFYYKEQGFLACTVYLDELRVAVVNMQGEVLDKVIVKKRVDED